MTNQIQMLDVLIGAMYAIKAIDDAAAKNAKSENDLINEMINKCENATQQDIAMRVLNTISDYILECDKI